MPALALDAERTWFGRFAIMLALSLVVAVTGLVADSPTLVIAATLIAPLLTPVLGFAAAVAMWWPRRPPRAGGTVAAASVGVVGLSWLLAQCPPGLVALAAGAAGACVLGVDVVGRRATVDLAADGPPAAVADLVRTVQQAVEGIEGAVRVAGLRPLPVADDGAGP